jgi:hypothetical protein
MPVSRLPPVCRTPGAARAVVSAGALFSGSRAAARRSAPFVPASAPPRFRCPEPADRLGVVAKHRLAREPGDRINTRRGSRLLLDPHQNNADDQLAGQRARDIPAIRTVCLPTRPYVSADRGNAGGGLFPDLSGCGSLAMFQPAAPPHLDISSHVTASGGQGCAFLPSVIGEPGGGGATCRALFCSAMRRFSLHFADRFLES